jgi:hypothetical protein
MATISMVNRVRFRVVRAETRLHEALKLLGETAAEPDYCGPALKPFEQVAAHIAELKVLIRNWAIDEALRRPPKCHPVVSRATGRKILEEAALLRR